jgi:hypothetical protein
MRFEECCCAQNNQLTCPHARSIGRCTLHFRPRLSMGLAALLLLAAVSSVASIPHYISSSNPAASDSNPGTDPAKPWKTLQRAAAAAPTFGTAGTDVSEPLQGTSPHQSGPLPMLSPNDVLIAPYEHGILSWVVARRVAPPPKRSCAWFGSCWVFGHVWCVPDPVEVR